MKNIILCFMITLPLVSVGGAGQYDNITLEQIMTPEQQKTMGIPKLSSQEKEQLRLFIIETYIDGFKSGKKEATKVVTTPDVIESQIDGDFEGWEGETIVKLMNGQIWQQSEYYYTYHYSFMPRVLIYKSGAGFKMKVENIDKAVGVVKLR